jgi:hypothetical protein
MFLSHVAHVVLSLIALNLTAMTAKAENRSVGLMPGQERLVLQPSLVQCLDASLNTPKFRWARSGQTCGIEYLNARGEPEYGEIYHECKAADWTVGIRSCQQNGDIHLYFCTYFFDSRIFRAQHASLTKFRTFRYKTESYGGGKTKEECQAIVDTMPALCN